MIILFQPLIILFVICDLCNLLVLWDENIFRRMLHHLQSNYNYHKEPYIHIFRNTLSQNDLSKLKSIIYNKSNGVTNMSKTLSNLLGGHYSKKNTLYYNDFNESSKCILDEIGMKHIPMYENVTNNKLLLGNSSFRGTILMYEGKESGFKYHYDTEEQTCYRSIYLIYKKGIIPPFTYFNKDNVPVRINLNVGDGIFFKGTTTYHGIESLISETAMRYVVGWQYCTENTKKEYSLCSEMRGATITEIMEIFLPIVYFYYIIMLFFHKSVSMRYNNVVYYESVIITIINLYVYPEYARYIGSGRTSELSQLIVFFLFCSIMNLQNFKATFVLYNYILITEMLFSTPI